MHLKLWNEWLEHLKLWTEWPAYVQILQSYNSPNVNQGMNLSSFYPGNQHLSLSKVQRKNLPSNGSSGSILPSILLPPGMPTFFCFLL